MGDNSASQLIEDLKKMTPSEAMTYLDNLSLSAATRAEILSSLKHVAPVDADVRRLRDARN